MNARILEIIKTPNQIVENDLAILEKEITKYPFMQSLRALYLYGLHQFQHENYSSNLATTAAFTTDKKILYNLINSKFVEKIAVRKESPEIKVSKIDNSSEIALKSLSEKSQPTNEETLDITNTAVETNKEIIVEKSLVETIQEKELQKNNTLEMIDEEKNEVETIVKLPNEINAIEKNEEIAKVESAQETDLSIIQIPIITTNSTAEITNDDDEKIEKQEINFHGVDEFIPQIAIKPASYNDGNNINQQLQLKKEKQQQDEMQKLIAEVEAKMKLKKAENKPKTIEIEESHNSEINFSENHDVFVEEKKDCISASEITAIDWKPLDLSTENTENRFARPTKSTQETEEIITPTNSENTISIEANITKPDSSSEKDLAENKTIVNNEKSSNIPNFLNSWHNWLQLDKDQTLPKNSINIDEQIEKEKEKEKIKTNAIDVFIENEPKISKLKNEPSIVQKDRGDDVSHLMTDTLVGLYVEQRLYAKAINGYEILIEKFPTKKSFYLEKIEEVKTLKSQPKSNE